MKTIIILLLCGIHVCAFTQSEVVSAEYFFNPDPGFGNGTSLDITVSDTLAGEFEVPVAGLNTGLHILHVRVQDEDNTWSLYARKAFFIYHLSGVSELASAEYFFDEDPGLGNGSPLTVSPGPSINESFVIPTDTLTPGLHVLHIRVQNNTGRWSRYARRALFVQPTYIDHDIVEVEYFIDNDPGFGNGHSLSFDVAHEIDEVFNIELSDTLSDGDHLLYIRVLNDAGKWSLYANSIFTIGGDVGISESDILFDLYPNPAEEVLNLTCGDHLFIEKIIILDMHGKVVVSPDPQLRQIAIQALSAGTYLIQVRINDHVHSKRFVKL